MKGLINLRDTGFDGLSYTLVYRISDTFAAACLQERQEDFLKHRRHAQHHQRQSIRWILKLMGLRNNCIVPSYLCGNMDEKRYFRYLWYICQVFQMYVTHNGKRLFLSECITKKVSLWSYMHLQVKHKACIIINNKMYNSFSNLWFI